MGRKKSPQSKTLFTFRSQVTESERHLGRIGKPEGNGGNTCFRNRRFRGGGDLRNLIQQGKALVNGQGQD